MLSTVKFERSHIYLAFPFMNLKCRKLNTNDYGLCEPRVDWTHVLDPTDQSIVLGPAH